jgi:small subunit ribosomal protein S6
MTTYEILMLLDPERAEARQDDIVARTRDLVEKSGGAWHSHDAWGRRRLAYPIAHKEEGVYHLVVFDAEAETLDEVSRVLRHLATRHIAGSRTSAPRDDAAASAPAPVEVTAPETGRPAATDSDDDEPEYAGAEEQPGEAGSVAGEADDAPPANRGEEE